jgi:two-component system, OmpR family, osmolarity sensor histidine kinase EnvZ
VKRTLSLFRYTLLRTVAALFVFELLVGVLAYALLLHPVLDKRAQSFAQQLLQNSASLPASVARASVAPPDGGRSYLPFNYLLAKQLASLTGQVVEVHRLAHSTTHYWLRGMDGDYLIFDQQQVVGAQPLSALLAWLGLAVLVALAVAAWLARGIAQPMLQLRRSLQQQALSSISSTGDSLGIAELDALRADFFSLTDKLALARDDRTTLLLGLSHELSAPVARLTMSLELYARAVPSERRSAMQADTEAMRRIIEQFLSAARCIGEPSPASLTDLVNWLRQHYGEQPRVTLHAELPNRDIKFNIIAAERILINLIDNALRHTQNAAVQVAIRADDAHLFLHVSDAGQGLSEDEIVRVLQPFKRSASSAGAGLGLALVRLLAEQNGWQFSLKNRQPLGMIASIKIPLC